MNGKKSVGRGLSPLDLDKRNKLRQIARANQLLKGTNKLENDLNGNEMALHSFQPPKAKRQQLKTLESKNFQTMFKKVKAMKSKICIVEISKIQLEIKVKIRQ